MRPKRIVMLVDDNEAELRWRAFVLETRGYRVLRYSKPRQALDALREPLLPDLGKARLFKCRCCGKRAATTLCDFSLGEENGTCDAPMCDGCRHPVGADLDHCPAHFQVAVQTGLF